MSGLSSLTILILTWRWGVSGQWNMYLLHMQFWVNLCKRNNIAISWSGNRKGFVVGHICYVIGYSSIAIISQFALNPIVYQALIGECCFLLLCLLRTLD